MATAKQKAYQKSVFVAIIKGLLALSECSLPQVLCRCSWVHTWLLLLVVLGDARLAGCLGARKCLALVLKKVLASIPPGRMNVR